MKITLSKQQWEFIGNKTGWIKSDKKPIKDINQKAQLIKKTYFYHINLNERGQFYADVRDEKGNTIFEIKGFEIFEDGFMTNVKDMNGLKNYLVNLSLISKQDELKYIG
jgi:hypothetical protein